MLFVEAYMAGNNATQAAITAGYSANSARVTACRLLARDSIKAEVARRREGLIAKLDLSPEKC